MYNLNHPNRIFLDYFDIQVGSNYDIFDDYFIKALKLRFEFLAWPRSELVVAAPAIAKSTNTLKLLEESSSLRFDNPIKLSLNPIFSKNLSRYVSGRLPELEKDLDERDILNSVEYSGYNKNNWKQFDMSLSQKQREKLYVHRTGDADQLFRTEMKSRFESSTFIKSLSGIPEFQTIFDTLLSMPSDNSLFFQRENILSMLTEFQLSQRELVFIERELNRGFNASGAIAVSAKPATRASSFDAATLLVLSRYLPYSGYPSFASKIESSPLSLVRELAKTPQWLAFRDTLANMYSVFYSTNQKELVSWNTEFSKKHAKLFVNSPYEKFIKSAILGTIISISLGLTPASLLLASTLGGVMSAMSEGFLTGRKQLEYFKLFNWVCETIEQIEKN